MAAGAEAGRVRSSSSSSSAALESTMDRRFQTVSNTMESIQSLSSWCIENKKNHSQVVRYWMKWLKKSEPGHRLNLFYLANDVIQNCKRKNAIAYRSSFADVLPDAALLVRDAKVRKSVERIFNIWQERSVYPEELITELKTSLQKKEQQQQQPPPPPPVAISKTALKSKIVAEFAPHVLIDRLAVFKRSLEESELREKQLTALRVDVCSTEALKRLKDKAGGNKFSKDFEEGSLKLQEFVKFLEVQMQAGPPLLEALGNADVFYEMQYKEVKIVANAYKTFANRVSNLKRKLDALKATLPDVDDSPIPSPSEDAPSPTGSESPFHGLGIRAGPGSMDRDTARAGDQKDNRDVEDMDLSEEEEEEEEKDTTNTGIIVEDKKEKTSPVVFTKTANTTAGQPPNVPTSPASAPPTKTTSEPAANQTPPTSTAPTPTTPIPASPAPLQVNLANVDLGKISSILSSITNVMKNTGVSPVSRPSPGTPTTQSSHTPSSKAPLAATGGTPASNPLASILSRVDISPEGILSALTKTQTNSPRLQGLSSLLSSARAGSLTSPSPAVSSSTPASSTVTTATVTMTPTSTTPTTPKTPKTPSNNIKHESERERGIDWDKVKEKEREKEKERREREREREKEMETMPSLESKINSFLQGNPGFGALGLDDGSSNSPLLVGGDNADGTPVRDESGSTPTQDEIMDTPCVLGDPKPGCSGGLSPTAYRSDPWDAVITPREDERKDRDYRTHSSSSRSQAFNPSSKTTNRSTLKSKEQDGMKKKAGPSAGSTSSTYSLQDLGMKVAKMEGSGGKSVALRRPSGGSQNGGKEEEKGKKGGKKEDREHYHRIETVVTTATSSNEGTPIETLGYSNRIQTVESIRVIGRGPRRASGAAARAGGAWYEEEEFMDTPPPLHSSNHGPESPDELRLVPPPAHLVSQGQYPPPPYTSDDSTHPGHTIPQHHPPPSPFFPTPQVPPIPQPPPPPVAAPPTVPPMPQSPQGPSRDFPLSPTSAVMVGGVLVPIDRVLPHPPANLRPEGGGPCSNTNSRAKSHPVRSNTLKEQFSPLHAPPLHRPGAPGVPPPLMGRGRDGPPSPSTPTTPTTHSPSGDPRPLLPSPNCLSTSAGAQRARRPPSPLPHIRTPLHSSHTPPLSQRTLSRGGLPLPLPPPNLSREPLLPGVKRPGPAFRGGLLHPPKRPFLPPRY